MKGLIFDIKRYSIHDGEGIRTTIFFKGCPLSCLWCHNPESQSFKTQLVHYENKCINCKTCEHICKKQAIKIIDNKAHINKLLCNMCLDCTKSCPTNALSEIGALYSINELVEEILKDKVFYSEGGVTISGGEPFSQAKFLLYLVKKLKDYYLNIAIDTSGYTNFSNIEKILDYTDQFLYDLKIMDPQLHKKYTGVSNQIILENLEKLSCAARDKITIRLPIIPTINDNLDNLSQTAIFLKKLKIHKIDLLFYHNIMLDKYRRLNMEFKLQHIKKPSDEAVNSIANFFKSQEFIVNIGG
ncbi:Pyruvate formate-lyase activating enzyme [Desulfurella amilsii]|uniref:Pyruvate formate-lyase activating enzyme n=1 Tax=Desulfurella amilsii TaxID=1562698 RepID=A0A1X4XUK2_9BACT|nr:glycyl-radical enzyme activating protein [Desulfurella amilsii]OSS41209.1 Pyruvate formate-lyase activating enzyme [Desulfurella amilsii]